MRRKKVKNRPVEEIEQDIRKHMDKLYQEPVEKKSNYDKEAYQEKAKRLKEYHNWYRK